MHVPYLIKSKGSRINQRLKGILRADNRIGPLLRSRIYPRQSRPCHQLALTFQALVDSSRNIRSAAGWPPTPPVQQAASSHADQAGWHRRGSVQRRPSAGCGP